MNDTNGISRRGVLGAGAALSALATAGCIGDGGGGGGTKFDQRVEEGELTEPFDADEGDELSVTIEAEENGASVGVVPTESQVSFGDNVGWGWELGPDEETEEEIEIEESQQYSVFVSQGAAHVTVE